MDACVRLDLAMDDGCHTCVRLGLAMDDGCHTCVRLDLAMDDGCHTCVRLGLAMDDGCHKWQSPSDRQSPTHCTASLTMLCIHGSHLLEGAEYTPDKLLVHLAGTDSDCGTRPHCNRTT